MNDLGQNRLMLKLIFRIKSNYMFLFKRYFDPLRDLSSISLAMLHDKISKRGSLSYQSTAEYLVCNPARRSS